MAMHIDLWPIVGRAQLVQTFRPGEVPTKEGPFRTLRMHGWATPGVSVVTRSAGRASGRLTIFSVLNVSAARCAREGEQKGARAFVRAAARVEKSEAFSRLKGLLTGKSVAEVTAAVAGGVSAAKWPEFIEVLRDVARETRTAMERGVRGGGGADVITGTIREALDDGLVLQAESGVRTLVPRWLGQSAHREQVGDVLALVTDKLAEAQMVVQALPAIELRDEPRSAASPFGRGAPVRMLTAADARLLAGEPAPLKVLVPVTIEA